jgi:DNA-directed RNA polymerase subunit RPC12/RpoP
MPLPTHIDTVAEYSRRKKLAAKWSYPFLVAAVLSGAGLALLVGTDFTPPLIKAKLALLLMFAMVICWMMHLYFSTKYNRCPNCGAIPRGKSGGMIHDPWACPACGARLREGESLF